MSAFELIDDIELSVAAASIVVPVDTDYRRFRLTFFGIKDGTGERANVRLNGDTGTNYVWQELRAGATTVIGSRNASQTLIAISSGAALDANTAGAFTVEIDKPATSTPARCTSKGSWITSGGIVWNSIAAEWNNTADLISALALLPSSGNFDTGSSFLLEGLAA